MKILKREAFNIPNILCYIRILIIPVFVYFLLQASSNRQNYYYLSAFFILLSGLTDMLDGYIARRFNMITDIGKLLDPIADKLTQLAMVFCLLLKFEGMIPLVCIFLAKECFMGVACIVVFKRNNKKLDGAKWFGKVCTAVFYGAVFLVIAMPNMSQTWVLTLVSATIATMLLSFAMYGREFYKMAK